MKTLKPIEYQPKSEEQLEKPVLKVIEQIIFEDIAKVLKKYNAKSFENANGALREGIRNGRIQYQDGEFTGKVNAKMAKEIRKLGGTFDSRSKTWKLPSAKMPPELSSAVAVASNRFLQMHKDVMETLKPEKIAQKLNDANFQYQYERVILGVEKEFKESVKVLGIKPELNPEMVKTLSEQYNTNMKRYIKNWAEQNIVELRSKVEKNAFNGARAENLVKMIERDYGVSQRKAKFLASQETRLITGEFTKERYKGAGVTKYKWSTSNDSRVRGEHKELHGKVFMWDEAVIDERGTRGNPKEAFGCRCTAIPIVE